MICRAIMLEIAKKNEIKIVKQKQIVYLRILFGKLMGVGVDLHQTVDILAQS